MTVTIELPPEIQDWVNRKLESKEFGSPEEFLQSQLYRDWLEEKIEEAIQEPATPLNPEDWAEARRQLEKKISSNQ